MHDKIKLFIELQKKRRTSFKILQKLLTIFLLSVFNSSRYYQVEGEVCIIFIEGLSFQNQKIKQ